MFRRRRDRQTDDDALVDEVDEAEDAGDEPADPGPPPRPQGPWDVDDAPDDGLDRLDLGGIRVSVAGVEMRIDVTPQAEVVAVTFVSGQTAMQVSAFAAPRSEGIWAEVREEIAAELNAGTGSAREETGRYGVELHARVPTTIPGQGLGLQPARFLGVDGPRWFLRGMLTGLGAVDDDAAAPLLAAFANVVVVRGTEAMAARDRLPLRLPPQVAEAQAAGAVAAGQGAPPGGAPAGGGEAPLGPLERGPEITETR